jgi:quercetin dioxygenase-like cupin family protein
MCQEHFLRFVTDAEAEVELLPWGRHEWLSRAGLTGAQQLQLVRVKMPPGKAHAFHRHPGFEEVLYILEGRAEQWVGRSKRILGPGATAFVPTNEVHGTYNIFAEPLTFLAILSPASFDGPALIDVSQDEPWKSIRLA